MNGVSDSEFAPDDTVTRAMFVTILFRMENEPVVNFALVFADVLPGSGIPRLYAGRLPKKLFPERTKIHSELTTP